MILHHCRYENCRDWGWSDSAKQKELDDPEGRYIIAYDRETTTPVGFAHIRFTLDGNVKLCYL